MNVILITCSYRPDWARCQKLMESVKRYVSPEIEHLLIVPEADRFDFSKLANDSTRIITTESILPPLFRRIPGLEKWWWTGCSLPVRGWIMQQITKLSVAAEVESDVLIFVDSDVTFIQTLQVEQFVKEGRVRLYRVPETGKKSFHLQWHRAASKMLGLPAQNYFGADYISQLVSWHRGTVLQLLERLESVRKYNWQTVLCRTLQFSEYILYGIFVEHVLQDDKNHYFETQDLCHCSWHYDVETELGRKQFLEGIANQHMAILIQSTRTLDLEQRSRISDEMKLKIESDKGTKKNCE